VRKGDGKAFQGRENESGWQSLDARVLPREPQGPKIRKRDGMQWKWLRRLKTDGKDHVALLVELKTTFN
jgi:hypothetical protein